MMTISPRVFRSLALFSLCCGLAVSPGLALGQDLQFELEPEVKLPLFGAEGTDKKPAGKEVEVILKPAAGDAGNLKPGDKVTLAITVNVPKNSYTYSTTTPAGGKTVLKLKEVTGLEEIDKDFQPERKPKEEFVPDFGEVEKYVKPITWTRQYRLKEGVKLSEVSAQGSVKAQICDESTCRILSETFAVALTPKAAGNKGVVQTARPMLGKKPGPAALTATLSPKDAKPGDKVMLTVAMDVEEGWHTYSISQKKAIGARATEIKIASTPNLKPLGEGFQPSEPFETKEVDIVGMVVEHEIHHGTISWSREYEVLPEAKSEGFGVEGSLEYQTCDASQCFPGSFAFDLHSQSAEVSQTRGGRETVSEPNEAAPVLTSREERLQKLLGEPVAATATEGTTTSGEPEEEAKGFWLFITTAVLAGFAALLTPCVYPMVPITISFFTKQAEKEHHRPTTLALVYCGGIMATFTVLGLLISVFFQATALNQLANNIWLNLLLTVVITFFGISMLGVFEIHVPSWLLTWSAGKESKGGIVGTLFMALTFTLVSFTCTFAFAGGLLVMASKGEYFWPIVGMLAFSGAFAFPFFLLALFPKMLTRLPKSGGWMNIMKVTMGFVEIGAALKFLSVADTVYFGQPTYLTYNVVMGAWFVLALAAGLYPLGLYRMPHDMPGKFTSGRLAFAAPFLALAAMLGTALFTPYQPSGWVWNNIAAFAPPKFEGGTQPSSDDPSEMTAAIGPYLEHDNLTYALDFFQALEYAKKTNQPLFLDITGQNCLNCRLMEKGVFPKPQNRELLKKFVRVQLFTDQIPLIKDEEERESLLRLNQQIQLATEDVSLPGYVILNPHDLAENGKLKPLSKFLGLEQEEGKFTAFLDEGLRKWQEQSGQQPVQSASTASDGSKAVGTVVTQN